MSRDPDDPIVLVDNERHAIALAPCNSAIDEEILQLLVARQSGRLKSVAGAAAADGETAANAPDERDRAVARFGTVVHDFAAFGRAVWLNCHGPPF